MASEDLDSLINAIDPDRDGKIHCTDWLAATLSPSALTNKKAMREAFDFFDIHGEGQIPRDELCLREIFGDDVALNCCGHLEEDGHMHVGWLEFQELLLCIARQTSEVTQDQTNLDIPELVQTA